MNYDNATLVQKARELSDMLDCYNSLVETVNSINTYFGDDNHAQSYWLASLKIATNSGHGYVTRDTNMAQALGQLAEDINELLGNEPGLFKDAGIDTTELIETLEQCLIIAAD